MITPANEYAELRREILQWQQLRVVVLAAVMAAVTTTLARMEGVRWEFVSGMLLFIVLVGQLFSVYASRGNAKLSAYIQVFCERQTPGWETHSQAFTRDFATGYFGRIMALVYLALATASVVVPLSRCQPGCFTLCDWRHVVAWNVVGGLALLVLSLAVWEWCRRSPRDAFRKEWERIKKEATDKEGQGSSES